MSKIKMGQDLTRFNKTKNMTMSRPLPLLAAFTATDPTSSLSLLMLMTAPPQMMKCRKPKRLQSYKQASCSLLEIRKIQRQRSSSLRSLMNIMTASNMPCISSTSTSRINRTLSVSQTTAQCPRVSKHRRFCYPPLTNGLRQTKSFTSRSASFLSA